MYHLISRDHSGIDILINNAAVYGPLDTHHFPQISWGLCKEICEIVNSHFMNKKARRDRNATAISTGTPAGIIVAVSGFTLERDSVESGLTGFIISINPVIGFLLKTDDFAGRSLIKMYSRKLAIPLDIPVKTYIRNFDPFL